MDRLNDLITKGFLALLSIIAVWIGSKIDSMGDSVNQLNLKIAVLIEQQSQQKESLKEHEIRLDHLEKRRK